MTGLATNVLVRFLVRDDPTQGRKAKALIDGLDGDERRGYVSDIVLCELVWVLSRGYRFERSRIAETLRKLVASRQLRFDTIDSVLRALAAYQTGKADFADYLIREHAKAAGCTTVATFDSLLLGEEMFVSP